MEKTVSLWRIRGQMLMDLPLLPQGREPVGEKSSSSANKKDSIPCPVAIGWCSRKTIGESDGFNKRTGTSPATLDLTNVEPTSTELQLGEGILSTKLVEYEHAILPMAITSERSGMLTSSFKTTSLPWTGDCGSTVLPWTGDCGSTVLRGKCTSSCKVSGVGTAWDS